MTVVDVGAQVELEGLRGCRVSRPFAGHDERLRDVVAREDLLQTRRVSLSPR